MIHHGINTPSGMTPKCTHHQSQGRFRRLFPQLPRLISNSHDLRECGKKNGPMDSEAEAKLSNIDLGYVFLGQFIDHDITLDVTSSLSSRNTPDDINNIRTPTLDLDCIYGSGVEGTPHLYYHAPPNASGKPKQIDKLHLLTNGDDLLRAESTPQGHLNQVALIGDPRNDENRIVSQFQLLMHYFHNTVVNELLTKGSYTTKTALFEKAREIVTWHYQWVVIYDFLPKLVGQTVVDDIMCNGRRFFTEDNSPFIPVEFSVAAYRFGHTMVTNPLDFNESHKGVTMFGSELGTGFQKNTAGAINWSWFFGEDAQKAGAIDEKLPSELLELPFIKNAEASLAVRNLQRGQSFSLPSGQSVHKYMESVLGVSLDSPDMSMFELPGNLAQATPLWLYILCEGSLSGGNHLGPVGGYIVAEVLIGLIESDPHSFLGSNPSWYPELKVQGSQPAGAFEMADIIKYTDFAA